MSSSVPLHSRQSSMCAINSWRSADEISPAAARAQSSLNCSWFGTGHLQPDLVGRYGRSLDSLVGTSRFDKLPNLREPAIVMMAELRQRLSGSYNRLRKPETLEVDQVDRLPLFVVKLRERFFHQPRSLARRERVSAR